MSDTPRTDAILPLGSARNNDIPHYVIELAGLCRSLERELSARHITPLQAAERAFIEAFGKSRKTTLGSREYSDSVKAMIAAWNHLQQIEGESNG